MSILISGSFGYSKRVGKPCSVTIGNFDGVHAGHKKLLQKSIAIGKDLQIPSCVYTFEPSPRTLLAPHLQTPRIMTWQDKVEKIFECGIDYVVIEEFTPAFAQHPPLWFANEIIKNRLKALSVTVGYDFRYGKARAGTVTDLRNALEDTQVIQIEAHKQSGTIISSSRIRELISDGKIEFANQLLGDPYEIRGVVVIGDQRGREIGFPTANVETNSDLIPASGVYAVQVQINRSEWRDGMVNLGTRPTFGGRRFQIEVHIFNFEQDIYGDELTVRFVQRIRSERRFDTAQKLTDQLFVDMKKIRECLDSRVS
jgi:riboflavin kinase / FMN adenylyltransferase